MKVTCQVKMRLLLILAFGAFTIGSLKAQFIFQKTYGGAVLDWCNKVIQLPDSNIIMLCSTKNFGSGMQDILLMKTNSNGDTLWSHTYGGSSNDEEGTDVIPTPDGGFIISGLTESFGAGGKEICLIKTDASGNISWSKTYGGANVEENKCLQICMDGGFIICGATSSYGAGQLDAYLIKTDSVGDTLWTKTYGTNGIDKANGVFQSVDLGFIITGTTEANGSQDVFVIKTDIFGEVVWAKTYGGTATDLGNSISVTNAGIFMGGCTNSFGTTGMDALLLKIDFNGDTLWSKTFGTNDSDAVFSIQPTSDGGMLMSGFANKLNNVGDDILFIKTDSSGNMVWEQIIGSSTNARDVGLSACEALDDGYLVTGYTQSFGGGTDIILIKTDANGFSGCNIQSDVISSGTATVTISPFLPQVSYGCMISSPVFIEGNATININTLCFTTGINQLANIVTNESTVSPNPFHNYAVLNIKGLEDKNNLLFTMTDILGKEVRRITIKQTSSSELVIERGSLSPGIYLYSVISSGFQQSTPKTAVAYGKLIIQ